MKKIIQIPVSFLIASKQINGVGDATTQKCCKKQKVECKDNLENFAQFIEGVKRRKTKNVLSNEISYTEIEKAYNKALEIIDNCNNLNIGIITFQDENYPRKLLNYKDYPSILYYLGDITILNTMKSVAVIGTRRPTKEGVLAGKIISEYLANKNINIISGLAVGCDALGHQSVVDIHKTKKLGVTTALLPSGLDSQSIYPPENLVLAQEIVAEGGLLLSKYPPKFRGNRYTLVERDRYQALLSSLVIPIQTGVQGGTMHAVRIAFNESIPVLTPKLKSYADNKVINMSKYEEGYFNLIDLGAMKLSSSFAELKEILDS